MSNVLIAFLLGAGVGGWVYSKVSRQTGGNAKTSLITAGVAGFVAFVAMWIITGMLIK